ncbi:riboflavin synthase [Ruminococcus albus]|uniref:Riboflavin synthase n=1 Tax=Ruminococcus albus (strain ATCC 27210 / DSM 20455 / JCM 14654 / NCDO 2250 / 7) TaxID=697329 RepID=E6UHS0_RUMA7|nr:riboflavin synthase [Ruminococcus albus]ADU22119.1 riboflavin synthase, alpha subunit [Ruminococcus albus 7 = DSM 20455]
MFTGLIEETGTVCEVCRNGNASFIRIAAEKVLEGTKVGDSIAVNGVCLTVTEHDGKIFRADVMNETLSRSSLGTLKQGSKVDLERAMSAEGRFGGHIVSGHIDGTGTVSNIKQDGIAVRYTISADEKLLRYIVEKGSVTLDGISLTVAAVTDTDFTVSVIPHTAEQTILPYKKVGDIINIETDIIGKYVEKLLRPAEPKKSGVTMEQLMKNGFI